MQMNDLFSVTGKIEQKKPRKLTDDEINFLAEYFHNEIDCPDSDGYIGSYTLPESVMKVYRKKYSKEREWD